MTTSPTRRSGKALALTLLAIAIAVGVSLTGWWFYGLSDVNEERELITTTVVSGPYEHVITEQGNVENASYIELKCEVRSRGYGTGGIAIINVLPEGTLVEPGDVVVELDSSALEQERVTQLIQVTGQRALLTQAENQLAAAQIARREYEQGTFVQEERMLIADAYVVQQTLSNAETALEAAKKLFDRAVITAKQVESATFAVEDAKNRLLASRTKLENLRIYAKEKMLKTFDSNIATASADVSASQARLALEERKLKDIEDQIEKCTIRAPVAGEVIHANEYDSDNGNIETDFLVQAGALVRERQTIVNLPRSNEMQIRATVGQARVTLVRPGMPVTIRVDALKDQLIQGEVTKVNQYADPSNWSSGNIKKYATYIKVFDPPPGLRGGMIAEVRIQIDQRPEALQVPVQALAQHKGRYFSLVKNGEDYETREVQIASTNDKVAVIEQGLSLGDVLVMSPRRAGGLLELPNLPDLNPAAIAGKPRSGDGEVKASRANKDSQREPAQPAGGGE
jgi:multidrug resistance efflux pump